MSWLMPKISLSEAYVYAIIANQLRLHTEAEQLKRIYPDLSPFEANTRLWLAQLLPPKLWTEGWREPVSEWEKIP